GKPRPNGNANNAPGSAINTATNRDRSAARTDEDLPNPDIVVRQKDETPNRMGPAVSNGGSTVTRLYRSIHRLKPEMLEIEVFEPVGHGQRLRKDQLQFLTRGLNHRGVGLGADADPVDPYGRRHGAVAFDGDLETARMQGVDQRRVQLHQGLAAGADHQLGVAVATAPHPGDMIGHQIGGLELAAAIAVHADEIGVAEGAD